MKSYWFVLVALLTQSAVSFAVEEGQPAPRCPADTSASTLSVDPGLFKGKVVLIDFWATWCPPCIQSMPFFNKLGNELRSSGFEILAVNVDEDKTAVDEFLKSHPVDYPITFDPSGECPKVFGLKAMPSSYLLDKSGKIRHIFLGYRDSDQATIKEAITHLLAE